MAAEIQYVKKFSTWLEEEKGKKSMLLWGDPVQIVKEGNTRHEVKARGRSGHIAKTELCDQNLLEIYVIDIGQGDSVLFKTPDEKWHIVDAGISWRKQDTRKGIGSFLHWKFYRDLCMNGVLLENAILTHPDTDHYEGFIDILSGNLVEGKQFPVVVKNFYHSGIGQFKESPTLGDQKMGQVAPFPNGHHGIKEEGKFIAELLDGKGDFQNPRRQFAKGFDELRQFIGSVPKAVRMLSDKDKFLSGYAPGQGGVTIPILGPIMEDFGSGKGLRWLGDVGPTKNGHSVVLRLDYGKARILLAGDLNATSQQLLLSYKKADEFAADVVKACHHGAEDVNVEFVKAMKARATIISSGDNEDYSHPRPMLMGMSGYYGRGALGVDGKAVLAPLIYSTELARSVGLTYATSASAPSGSPGKKEYKKYKPDEISVSTEEWTKAKKEKKLSSEFRRLTSTPIAANLVYGLVNVRTDGEHILCATMKEKKSFGDGDDFDIKVFKAGVDV